MITLHLADEAATLKLAATLAEHAKTGDVIALSGDLGSGKTTFARGFIQAKQKKAEEVPSPTFTLVQLYEAGPDTIYHFDLYRLSKSEEAYELGIEEAFVSGISLIEWPEKLGSLIPSDRLEINFEFAANPQARKIILSGSDRWASRLKEAGLG